MGYKREGLRSVFFIVEETDQKQKQNKKKCLPIASPKKANNEAKGEISFG